MKSIFDALLPQSAASNRLFGTIWIFAAGQFAIVYALMAMNGRAVWNFSLLFAVAFAAAFVASLFAWKGNSGNPANQSFPQAAKPVVLILIAVLLSLGDWFPTHNMKFDGIITWAVLVWVLELVWWVRRARTLW